MMTTWSFRTTHTHTQALLSRVKGTSEEAEKQVGTAFAQVLQNQGKCEWVVFECMCVSSCDGCSMDAVSILYLTTQAK